MLRTSLYHLTLLTALLLPVTGSAENAYVTDKLIADIYTEPGAHGEILKSIPSGSIVDVLSKEGGYAKVRTIDKVVGWIDGKYLTNEKPVQMEFVQLVAKYNSLTEKLRDHQQRLTQMQELQKEALSTTWLREEIKKAEKTNAELEQSIKTKELMVIESQQRVNELQAELTKAKLQLNEVLQSIKIQAEQDKISGSALTNTVALTGSNQFHPLWLVSSLLATLVIGVLSGFVLIDYKIKKKHGDVLLY